MAISLKINTSIPNIVVENFTSRKILYKYVASKTTNISTGAVRLFRSRLRIPFLPFYFLLGCLGIHDNRLMGSTRTVHQTHKEKPKTMSRQKLDHLNVCITAMGTLSQKKGTVEATSPLLGCLQSQVQTKKFRILVRGVFSVSGVVYSIPPASVPPQNLILLWRFFVHDLAGRLPSFEVESTQNMYIR